MQKVKNLSNLSFRLRVHCNNPSLDTLYLFINRRIIQEIVANGAIGRTLLVIIYIYIYTVQYTCDSCTAQAIFI